MAETVTTSPNDEAIRAWDGPLFDRFVEFRDEVVSSLVPHGDEMLRAHPPAPGSRILEIGCGFGDMTQQLAALVGAGGEVVGIDAAPRFIAAATAEAADVPNASFRVADPQTEPDLGGPYDAAYARFGTMFFANPVVALRNVAGALEPGGRLTMTVWRRKLDNEWMYRGEVIVKGYLGEKPEDSDEPTCGPGPFSMANADTVCDVLTHAGYDRIELRRVDLPMVMSSLDRAIALVMALGPGGEVIRLLGDRADQARPQIEADLREGLAGFVAPDGSVHGPSSSWVVSAVRS
jgi:SAM-dependent methyltransferase